MIFCGPDSFDAEGEQARSDVAAMHTAVQTLADGLRILEYDHANAFRESIMELPMLG